MLLCACGGTADELRARVQSPLDWSRLARVAASFQAAAPLWHRLSETPGMVLPPDARALQSVAVLSVYRVWHIRALLERVVQRLGTEGIEVMLLKGASLLATSAATACPRSMSDLDLLVVRGSPERAWDACRDAGWTLLDHAWTPALYRSHHHLAPLRDPKRIGVGLELHRALFPDGCPLRVDVAAMLRRSSRVQLGNERVLVQAPEDLLLHVCLHFAWSHAMESAAWRTFADIGTVVADSRFAWPRFLEVVRPTRGASACYWALRLAAAAASIDVPRDVLNTLRPSFPSALGVCLERHFLAQSALADAPAEKLSQRVREFLWDTAVRPRASGHGAVRPWHFGPRTLVEETGVSADKAKAPAEHAFSTAITTIGYLLRLATGGRRGPGSKPSGARSAAGAAVDRIPARSSRNESGAADTRANGTNG